MKDFPEIRGKHRPHPPHWQPRTAATAPSPKAPCPSPDSGDASVPQALAAVAAGRDARSGGPGDSCRLSGKQGYWRRRWRRREPQTGSAAGTPGPPRRRGPPERARDPSGRPPAAASPYPGRPRHFRHTHTHTHSHTRARERGFRCRCQRQQAAAEPGLRRRSRGSSGREGHTHASTHTHAPRARQKCAFQVI